MKSKIATLIAATVMLGAQLAPQSAMAQKAATPMSVKVGYFNLQVVKASFPEAAGSEQLRQQADAQLRRLVEELNKKLQKAQDDKKPKEEIDKMIKDMQTEVNAQQQALAQLVQTQNAIATQAIVQAVNAVAKSQGLDLVVDSGAIFAGGDKLVNNAVDITKDVVKKLTPATLNTDGDKPQTGSTGSTN